MMFVLRSGKLLACCSALVLLSACGSRGGYTAPCRPLPPANHQFGPGLMMHLEYPSSHTAFRVEIIDDHHLKFEGLGQSAGVRGRPHFDSMDIADGVTFLTWEEDNGTIMSMVLDFVHQEVHAREVRNGQLRAVDGVIEIERPAHY